ncbi:MAG: glutamate formimidoyltransferase [Chloroflexi bacterium]|nr:glutamate formimidoyltransferase [Chloroflexota bacterium]MBU1746252.1 glutamate formimidoyltransferase [Chloroflexota bacterium]
MPQLVESAINFSEGRRADVIQEIVSAAKKTPGVALDVSSDEAHNRTVLCLIGPLDAVAQAAFDVSAAAVRLIDMNQHAGEHPRFGAVDVIPFVPLGETTMTEAVAAAQALGHRLGQELALPVYFYEAAAMRPERRNLADVRRGEYEGLAARMHDPAWAPDCGPTGPHPTAGAVAVGARIFLVAYNVNLGTADVQIARAIARAVRAKTGGLAYVKALGVLVEKDGRQVAQVTMNVTDPFQTPLYRVFELVRLEAERYGVPVTGSEIVGLTPLAVLLDAARYYLRLESFATEQVLETRVFSATNDTNSL